MLLTQNLDVIYLSGMFRPIIRTFRGYDLKDLIELELMPDTWLQLNLLSPNNLEFFGLNKASRYMIPEYQTKVDFTFNSGPAIFAKALAPYFRSHKSCPPTKKTPKKKVCATKNNNFNRPSNIALPQHSYLLISLYHCKITSALFFLKGTMSSLAGMATTPPNLPMQFLVDQPPYVSPEDFEKIWSEIIAQFNPRNDVITIDASSFNALSAEQRGELCERWM